MKLESHDVLGSKISRGNFVQNYYERVDHIYEVLEILPDNRILCEYNKKQEIFCGEDVSMVGRDVQEVIEYQFLEIVKERGCKCKEINCIECNVLY